MSGHAIRQSRFKTMRAVFLVACAALGFRLLDLATVSRDRLARLATVQRQAPVRVPLERGPIVDRHGNLLATTIEAADVYLRPRLFPKHQSRIVADVLGIPEAKVSLKSQSHKPFVWLKREAPLQQALALERLGVPGVGFERTRKRVYPRGSLAGQVIGSTGVDLQGLGGIEAFYEGYLLGRTGGWRTERDGRGQLLPIPSAIAEEEFGGARVELTIDAEFQRATEIALKDAVDRNRAKQGLAILLDPHSGAILALAHYPFFDPNERWEAGTERARLRAVTDPFEPGSTFKSFIAAAGLEAGVIRFEDRLHCEGGRYRVGNRTVRDHHPYGWLSFPEILRHSSNICTAKIGERLGAERVYEALVSFGFGRPTGVDLPGERVYPLRPWQRWARIHLVTTSFGQGVAVTPMQLAVAHAALANGGRLLRPYVVQRVVAPDGRVLREHGPQEVGRPISSATAATIGEVLAGVVEGGTGTRAKIEGVRVAGKTGTAQKVEIGTGRYSPRDRIASFVGHFPVENPRFVLLVVIDTPRTATYGGLVAAPAFQKIGDFLADRVGLRSVLAPVPALEIRPNTDPALRRVSLVGAAAPLDGMPSFIGMTLREALYQARRAGWSVEVEGSGFVVWQDPPPGAHQAPGKRLRLRLADADRGNAERGREGRRG